MAAIVDIVSSFCCVIIKGIATFVFNTVYYSIIICLVQYWLG